MSSVSKVKYRNTYNSVRGFALLEVLVAFIVMAGGILALLSFHAATQRNAGEAKAQAEAVSLAEAKLQELESYLTMTDVRLGEGDSDTETIQGQTTTFSRSWSVDDADPGCTPDPFLNLTSCQRVVTVTVNWRDRNTSAANTTGVLQSVVVSSDIDFDKPTEGIEQMARQLVDVYTAEDAGDFNPPVSDVGGKKEVLAIPVDEYEGTIPDGYAEEYVYVYRIYISGSISTLASTDETGEIIIVAPSVTVVIGGSNLSFYPVCSTTGALGDGEDPNADVDADAINDDPTTRDYWCRLYYLSTTDGVIPTITFNTDATAYLCAPKPDNPLTEAVDCRPPYPINQPLSYNADTDTGYQCLISSVTTGALAHVAVFNPLTVSALANVVIAPRTRQCP